MENRKIIQIKRRRSKQTKRRSSEQPKRGKLFKKMNQNQKKKKKQSRKREKLKNCIEKKVAASYNQKKEGTLRASRMAGIENRVTPPHS
jgi:hypothetical protein